LSKREVGNQHKNIILGNADGNTKNNG